MRRGFKSRHWTAQEERRLAKLRWAGMSHNDIAKILNRSVYSVQQRAHQIGASYQAVDIAEPNEKPTTSIRTCLRCGDPFQSEGPGHRRCPTCHVHVRKYGHGAVEDVPTPSVLL